MRIVVIGAGLIGVTTAYLLRRRGHEVSVVDRQEGPGRETSFANGALVTPSMPEPWNAPGSWRVLLGSIGRSDAPLQLRLKALPSLAGWGIRFLGNSRAAAFERNTVSNLKLALYSLEVLKSLREETRVDYPHESPGTLKLFRDRQGLERAAAWVQRLSHHGLAARELSRSETIQLEPALGPIASELAGAIHYAKDETGDAYRFCAALAEHAGRCGVEFSWGRTVWALGKTGNRITSLKSLPPSHGALPEGAGTDGADCYVVATCSYSTGLLRSVGVHLPVRPAKGYSVTFNRTPGEPALRIPVVDDDFHAALTPLEGALRAAGTAEFTGYDLTRSEVRVENLIRLIQKILPEGRYDASSARPWCGLRAMSADGVPLIGRTRFANLFVNTGHGHLGWTMTCGSAHLLADLICGCAAQIDSAPYNPRRFKGV
jgi:D-amino-acid dehydrogenase